MEISVTEGSIQTMKRFLVHITMWDQGCYLPYSMEVEFSGDQCYIDSNNRLRIKKDKLLTIKEIKIVDDLRKEIELLMNDSLENILREPISKLMSGWQMKKAFVFHKWETDTDFYNITSSRHMIKLPKRNLSVIIYPNHVKVEFNDNSWKLYSEDDISVKMDSDLFLDEWSSEIKKEDEQPELF